MDKGADKRFHITTDYEFSWCAAFVEGFDTFEEAESRRKELEGICDPYEVLVVRDTRKV